MSKIENLIDIMYNKLLVAKNKSSINLLLEGDPSSGKSFLIEKFAKSKNLKFVSLSAPTLVQEMITGIPYREGNIVRYSLPYWLENLVDGGILLIDEFNAADDDIQKILLSLLSERRINSHKLPDNVLIVAAQNNYKQVNNHKVSAALLSRFSKYAVSFDFVDWRTNHLVNILHPTALHFLDNLMNNGFTFSKGIDFIEQEISTTARSVERWLTNVEILDSEKLIITGYADLHEFNITIVKAFFKTINQKKDKANSVFGGNKNINTVLNVKLKSQKKINYDNIKKFPM